MKAPFPDRRRFHRPEIRRQSAGRRSRRAGPDRPSRCRPSPPSSISPRRPSCCRPRTRSTPPQVRIFTPKAEMPFAGHPNVGTAFVLAASAGRGAATAWCSRRRRGLVPIDLTREDGVVVAARLAAPQPLTSVETVPAEIVAPAGSACGAGDIVGEPIVASTGNKFLFAEVTSREALATASYNAEIFRKHLPMERTVGVHLYVAGAEHGVDIQTPHVRAAVRRARGSGDRRRQCDPDRPAGASATRAPTSRCRRPSARASTWAGRAARRHGREEGRQGHRHLYRRPLRADAERHDRSRVNVVLCWGAPLQWRVMSWTARILRAHDAHQRRARCARSI